MKIDPSIAALKADNDRLRSDNARQESELKAQGEREIAAWAERDQYLESNVKLVAEIQQQRALNARMRAAILDIIKRWPTERGIDGALTRARALIMDDALRNPDKDDVKLALEQKAP